MAHCGDHTVCWQPLLTFVTNAVAAVALEVGAAQAAVGAAGSMVADLAEAHALAATVGHILACKRGILGALMLVQQCMEVRGLEQPWQSRPFKHMGR